MVCVAPNDVRAIADAACAKTATAGASAFKGADENSVDLQQCLKCQSPSQYIVQPDLDSISFCVYLSVCC